MTAESLQSDPCAMRTSASAKRGEELERAREPDAGRPAGALPAGVEVLLVESTGGGVEVRVGGSLFGVGASVDALLSAQEGKLVAQPQGFPFAGLARITLFSDPPAAGRRR